MKPTEGYRRGQMTTRKLTPAQEYAVSTIEVLTDDITTAKRVIKRQIEEEFERRVEDLKRKRSRACNEALALGVPKRRISSAINTSNWTTLNETLALTADEFIETTQVEIDAPRAWDYDPATMVLTLHEYQQRFTGKMISAEVAIPGKMRYVMGSGPRLLAVAPATYPDDVDLEWLDGIYKQIRIEQGMVRPEEQPDAAAPTVTAGTEGSFVDDWMNAPLPEEHDDDWDME